MPAPSETLPALEQRLAERLLDFDLLAVVERQAAWSTWANRPGTMAETTEPRAVVSHDVRRCDPAHGSRQGA